MWLPGSGAWKHYVELVSCPPADINGSWGSEWSDSYEPSETSGGKLHELFNLKFKVFINEYK